MACANGPPPHVGPMAEVHAVISTPREEEGGGDGQVDGEEQLGRGEAALGEQNLPELCLSPPARQAHIVAYPGPRESLRFSRRVAPTASAQRSIVRASARDPRKGGRPWAITRGPAKGGPSRRTAAPPRSQTTSQRTGRPISKEDPVGQSWR